MRLRKPSWKENILVQVIEVSKLSYNSPKSVKISAMSQEAISKYIGYVMSSCNFSTNACFFAQS